MSNKTSTWVIVVETVLVCLFAFLYFKTCNVPIVSNTRIEDSLKHVAKVKDSVYQVKSDSGFHKLDSLGKVDSARQLKYDKLKPQVVAANEKVVKLQREIDLIKNSFNSDSLHRIIEDLNAAYFEAVNLINEMSQVCDSSNLVKDQRYVQAKALLDQTGLEIQDLRSQRDAALQDDHSKDSIINKLSNQKKANNIWAKIATIGASIAVVVAIFKN